MTDFFALMMASGVVYDADYQSLLTYATNVKGYTIPPDSTKKTKENACMVAIKAAFGVASIASAPIFQMLMFKTTGDSDYATLNWANPAIRQATKVNSPSFTSNLGFNSNGSSSYLNSGLAQTVFNANDFTIASRAHTNVAENTASYGVRDETGAATESLVLTARSSANGMVIRAWDNTTTTYDITSITDARNRIMIGRSNSTTRVRSINGAAFTTNTETSNPPENANNIFLLSVNDPVTGALAFSTQGFSYWIAFSRKLTNGEAAAVDAALINYLS
jgi:hypothetical protein